MMKQYLPLSVHSLVVLVTLLLAGCTARPTEPAGLASPAPGERSIDLRPFVEMAKSASCVDIENRLYVIDDQYVFWAFEGNCADAGYGYILYGETPAEKLCSSTDSIAGPQTSCQPELDALFQTILDHLDRPDLGLGGDHQVVLTDLRAP